MIIWSLCYVGFGTRTRQCSNQNSWRRSNRCQWDVSFVTMEMTSLMWQWICLFCPRNRLHLSCPAVSCHRLISDSGLSAAMVRLLELYDTKRNYEISDSPSIVPAIHVGALNSSTTSPLPPFYNSFVFLYINHIHSVSCLNLSTGTYCLTLLCTILILYLYSLCSKQSDLN